MDRSCAAFVEVYEIRAEIRVSRLGKPKQLSFVGDGAGNVSHTFDCKQAPVSDHSSEPEETPLPELMSGFQTVGLAPGGSEIWEDWREHSFQLMFIIPL